MPQRSIKRSSSYNDAENGTQYHDEGEVNGQKFSHTTTVKGDVVVVEENGVTYQVKSPEAAMATAIAIYNACKSPAKLSQFGEDINPTIVAFSKDENFTPSETLNLKALTEKKGFDKAPQY